MRDKDRNRSVSPGAAKVVRLDTRWLYGALGLLALAGVGSMGLIAGGGGRLLRSATPAAQPLAAANGTLEPRDPTAEAAARVDPASLVTLNVPTTIDGAPLMKIAVKGKRPADPADVPIGPSEARIWLPELAETDWELALGQIPPTGPVEMDVAIENIGTSPLALADAGGECGCTAVELEAGEIEPGGTGMVRIKYDPRVFRDAGKNVRRQIWVRSNDPVTPVVEFHITASVQRQ